MSREQTEFLIENMAALRALRRGNGQLLNGERLALLFFIADKTRNGEFWWGNDKLAAATGVNPSDISGHLGILRDAGAFTDRGMQSRGKYRSVKIWEVHLTHLLGEAPPSPSLIQREGQGEVEREGQGKVEREGQGEVTTSANPCADSHSTHKPKPKHETQPPTISVNQSAAELNSPDTPSTVGPRATEVVNLALDLEVSNTRNVESVGGFRYVLRKEYEPLIARLIYETPERTDEELARRAYDERNGRTTITVETIEQRWEAAERRKREAAEAEAQEEPAKPETIAAVRALLPFRTRTTT